MQALFFRLFPRAFEGGWLFYFLLPLFLLPTPSFADNAWRALLHFSGESGEISSVSSRSSFFLSPQGFRDPEAELVATKKYFAEEPEEAACRYPARAIYLRQGKLPEKTAEQPSGSDWCSRWRKWKDAINAKGAELVFASAFLASPSSMYGHTLLKFVRGGRSEGEDLLDYTLNYGANKIGRAHV